MPFCPKRLTDCVTFNANEFSIREHTPTEPNQPLPSLQPKTGKKTRKKTARQLLLKGTGTNMPSLTTGSPRLCAGSLSRRTSVSYSRTRGATSRLVVRSILAPEAPSEKAKVTSSVRDCALITAVKTPYLPSGKFDLQAFDELVENQIQNGVEGLIIGGTTGEGHLMSWDEHIMLIAHAANVFRGKIKVIGNTGSNSTREAVHASDQGFAVGMDAALHINPYYGKTSKEGLYAHFGASLEHGPAIVYNVPSRTGQDIPDDVIESLAKHENFLGVKECTGNERIGAYKEKGILSWSGNDDEAHAGRHEFDSAGVISVTSNLLPGLFSKLMREKDYELSDSLQELIAWLFCEPNPIPVNTALCMCGLVQPVFRLPYVPLNKERREEGVKLLNAVKEHIPGCSEVRVMEDSEFVLLDRY